MTRSSLALIAVYVPLIVMAGWAATLYFRTVIWHAWREKRLRMREHGIVIAMCASLSADVIEQLYWSTARLMPNAWPAMSWATGPIFGMKVIVLFGAMAAISAWHQAARGHSIFQKLVIMAAGLYLGAFLTLLMMFR